MLALDQTMLSFYTTDLDYGLDAVTKGLSTLSEVPLFLSHPPISPLPSFLLLFSSLLHLFSLQIITQRFIPILQSCNASSDITSALNSAAQTLTNLQTVNGTIAELIINQAEVYSEMASALGYWTRSNFFEGRLLTSLPQPLSYHICYFSSRSWCLFRSCSSEDERYEQHERTILQNSTLRCWKHHNVEEVLHRRRRRSWHPF
jgi:hypothetical protein